MKCKTLEKAERKPLGGYSFIKVMELCKVWSAYRKREIRLVDLRTWFACQELVARRKTMGQGRRPRYTIEEIHRLIGGVGGEHVRASLRRLEDARLVSWSEAKVTFPSGPEGLSPEVEEALFKMAGEIVNHRRKVPVPRRTLRFIAGGSRPAVIATILGYLFRCAYYRGGKWKGLGACKVSWMAKVFGISDRNIKAAKRHLVRIGWLIPAESPHWYQRRYGSRAAVNFMWDRTLSQTGSSLHAPFSTTRSSPLESNRKLLSEYRNQKSASRGPAGFSEKEGRGEKPKLRHVVPDDLRDTGRLLELFREAVCKGLLRKTESDRLRFVAAAEHARLAGTRNPPGLFSALVRRRLWHFSTQADEEAAQCRLKEYFFGRRADPRSRSARRVATVRAPEPSRLGGLLDGVLKEWASKSPCSSKNRNGHLSSGTLMRYCGETP